MVKGRKRILIFSNSYLPVIGGVQTVAHHVAKQLSTRGHEVLVVTNRYPVSLPQREEMDGIKVERILMLRPHFNQLPTRPDLFLASLYFGPGTELRLRKIFLEFRPDIVNVHFPDHQIPYVLKLRKEFNFRLVVSLHGHDVERVTNRELNGQSAKAAGGLKSILQSADAVTAVSHDLLNKAIELESAISAKSQVINNGIDPARYTCREAYQHPKPYLLGIGRLVRNKGFDLLIEAFSESADQEGPDLIIAGAGEERAALEQRVEELNLKSRVQFLGAASPHEVVKLMNGCIGVVVPSRSESFGIVALEALAAGKPVLATKVDGLKEILTELAGTEGHGPGETEMITLVTPNVRALADGLSRFRRVIAGSARRESALPEKFTWPYLGGRYEEILVGDRLSA